jgi:hypothetical protein
MQRRKKMEVATVPKKRTRTRSVTVTALVSKTLKSAGFPDMVFIPASD